MQYIPLQIVLFYFSSKNKFVAYKATKVETFFALFPISANIYNILVPLNYFAH
ncbi:hypothetical protein GCM10007084_12540 [Parabacteroides faecis]|nr:hypothetical protein GCM10007084_12540 [Parabacteroides faecis]GKG73879.1 hypothetical protein CE91St1_30220 [Parabacteroides goldsteinii]GKG79769.1 hypothetical protein CE91St2_29610 [Parabacteroides goldsteinii]